MYDVVIIGAGVTGSSVAREISKYDLKVCVLEKEEDVCSGTSKANSALVHAGYDAMPGTLKARLNRQGNEIMEALSKELDFPFKRIGSLVVSTQKEDPILQELFDRGIKNGIPRLEIIRDKKRLRAMEPDISDEIEAALYAPTAGIVCPFDLNLAMAENAAKNGVEFFFNTKVCGIDRIDGGYAVKIKDMAAESGEGSAGTIKTRCVVNAAGLYADAIHNMVSADKIGIIPKKGEYILLDKGTGQKVDHIIFSVPVKDKGKGILVTPTVHGNLLVGPTSNVVGDREDMSTTSAGLDMVRQKASSMIKDIPFGSVITSFAGLRAHPSTGDFIIEEVKDAPGFVDCAGIESPGLTAAPAVGIMAADIVADILKPARKTSFDPLRKGIKRPSGLSVEERHLLIKENPSYASIVCRCEMISEGEICDALYRPLGAVSMDGIKRRTRAGMGRCQSGFCSPRVMELLAEKLKKDMTAVNKSSEGSAMLLGDRAKGEADT